MRIAHGKHICIVFKVVSLDFEVSDLLVNSHFVQVPPIDTLENLEHPFLGFMQARVNSREHRGTLLD